MMNEPFPIQPKQLTPRPPHRAPLPSLTQMPTHLITLSPALVEALKNIAPKGPRRVVPYVLGLVALAALVWVGVVPSVRHRVAGMAQRVLRRETVAAQASPPADTARAQADPLASPASPTSAAGATTATPATPTADAVAAAPTAAPQSDSHPSALASASKTTKTPRKPHRRAPR